MHPAYSVILFTTAAGAGYGLLALIAMVALAHGAASTLGFGRTASLLSFGLITVGLMSSTLHLGHPERAWRALSQWRSSWLSREGVAAVLTYPVGLAFSSVWCGFFPESLLKPLALATILMAGITVGTTGMIYASLKTIKSWNHWLTVMGYYAWALATGGLLLSVTAGLFGRGQMFLYGFTTVLLVLALLVKLLWWRADAKAPRNLTPADATGLKGRVRQWEVPHTSANYLMKEMGYQVARNHARKLRRLFLQAMGFAIFAMLLASLFPAFGVLYGVIGLGAGILAVLTERWLFFAEARHVVNLYYGMEAA